MKKIIFLALLLISISCNSKKFPESALATTLLNENNKQIAFNDILKKHIGHIVLIEVWAGWCSDCVKNMPNLKKLQANHPTVDFLFISMDKTSDKWKEAIAKHEIIGDHFMVNDGMKGFFGTAMEIDWIPRYIILNKSGEIELLRAIETDFDKVNKTLLELEKK